MTIQELLDFQREIVPVRCSHCGRDAADRDHELVQAALRARLRLLEAQVCELEAELKDAVRRGSPARTHMVPGSRGIGQHADRRTESNRFRSAPDTDTTIVGLWESLKATSISQ